MRIMQRRNNVDATSYDVALTLIRPCINGMCPLGTRISIDTTSNARLVVVYNSHCQINSQVLITRKNFICSKCIFKVYIFKDLPLQSVIEKNKKL